MGTVKYPKFSRSGKRFFDPPQKIMCKLFSGWLLKRCDVHALRIYLTDDMADNTALPGSIHCLEHQQNRSRVTKLTIRKVSLLQVTQIFGIAGEHLFG